MARISAVANEVIKKALSSIFSVARYKMKPGTITHTIAALLSSISSLFGAHSASTEGEPTKVKLSKKSNKLADDLLLNVDSVAFAPRQFGTPPSDEGERTLSLEQQIVTTTFLDRGKADRK